MRFLLLVLLFGLAAALPRSGFYRDERDGDDVKTELGRKLKEHLEEILAKIKDAIDQGKGIKDDLFEKAKEIRKKLKELHIEIKGKLKEMIEKVRNRVKDFLRKLLDGDDGNVVRRRHLDDKAKDLIRRLKNMLKKTFDTEKIRQFIEDKIPAGDFRQLLLKNLKNGRNYLKRIIDLLDRGVNGNDNDDDDNDNELQEIADY